MMRAGVIGGWTLALVSSFVWMAAHIHHGYIQAFYALPYAIVLFGGMFLVGRLKAVL
jgi:hypothetical protein